jgi:hypothetical protein
MQWPRLAAGGWMVGRWGDRAGVANAVLGDALAGAWRKPGELECQRGVKGCSGRGW